MPRRIRNRYLKFVLPTVLSSPPPRIVGLCALSWFTRRAPIKSQSMRSNYAAPVTVTDEKGPLRFHP